jgi:hypothetical protein
MRRISLSTPLIIVCVLAASAGCGSKATPQGAGGLVGANAPTTTATSTSTGGSTTTAAPTATKTTKTTQPTSDWPPHPNCITYNPNTLAVTSASGMYTISDGNRVVMVLHGQSDTVGKQGLALAQRYGRHCFLGQANTREDKNQYIFDYWRDPTGKTPEITDEDDLCSAYNKHNLTVEDMGEGNGWRVKDHDHVLHLFDSSADAHNGDLVLSKYGQICSIGDNDNGYDAVNFFR